MVMWPQFVGEGGTGVVGVGRIWCSEDCELTIEQAVCLHWGNHEVGAKQCERRIMKCEVERTRAKNKMSCGGNKGRGKNGKLGGKRRADLGQWENDKGNVRF